MAGIEMVDMKKILIVIADSSRVLFYIAHGPHNVIQINEIQHPEGRFEDHELTTKGKDTNTYPYEIKNSAKEHDKQHFAKVVVEQLDKILEAEHLKDLCIFAPPRFMGLINKDHLKKHINITEVTKEIVHLHANDLEKLVAEAGLNFMPD